VLEEKGLRNNGTDAARTEQPSQDGNEMDRKNLPDCPSKNGSRTENPKKSWANEITIRQPQERSPVRDRGRRSNSRSKKMRLIYSYMGMYCRTHAEGDHHFGLLQRHCRTTAQGDTQLFGAPGAPGRRYSGQVGARAALGFKKHLRALRDVGLVHVRREVRQMFYRTNAEGIRPLHEWAGTFERLWHYQLSRAKERAEAAATKEAELRRITQKEEE
jgi:hypothetical protein